MIKADDLELYSPDISRVIAVTRAEIVPSGSSGAIDSNGKKLVLRNVSTVYDRDTRGRNWFIIDMRGYSARFIPLDSGGMFDADEKLFYVRTPDN